MPTKKSPEIENLLKQLSPIGMNRYEAAAHKVCTFCGRQVGPFKDLLSEKEYEISGLCQICQDEVFELDEGGDL